MGSCDNVLLLLFYFFSLCGATNQPQVASKLEKDLMCQGLAQEGNQDDSVICQIVRDTMERVKQRAMGKKEFAFNGHSWKVLMSDTPSSITHGKFGSGLRGHLEKSSCARPRNWSGLCEGVVSSGVKGT